MPDSQVPLKAFLVRHFNLQILFFTFQPCCERIRLQRCAQRLSSCSQTNSGHACGNKTGVTLTPGHHNTRDCEKKSIHQTLPPHETHREGECLCSLAVSPLITVEASRLLYVNAFTTGGAALVCLSTWRAPLWRAREWWRQCCPLSVT